MRLGGEVSIVTGAGQTPGETIGNGRATSLLLAREGSKVLLVDRELERARETREMIDAEGGEAAELAADVTHGDDCKAIVDACVGRWGRVDVLVNNVGIAGVGDAGPIHLDEHEWRRIIDTNLTSMLLTCKHVLPVMRQQRAGSIVNICSMRSWLSTPVLAY